MVSVVLDNVFCLNKKIYQNVNSLAEKKAGNLAGRAVSILAAIWNISSWTLAFPIAAIEYAAKAALNLIGALFKVESCSLKNARKHIICSGFALALGVGMTVASPIFLILQAYKGIRYPETVKAFGFSVKKNYVSAK